MRGWEPPAAYGIGEVAAGDVLFPVVNVDAHGLPALALSQVCGHRSGTATYELTAAELRSAIELLAPAEACGDYEHPNLWAWRELLDGSEPPFVAVFLQSLEDAALDPAQRRLHELTEIRPLPTDIPGVAAGEVLDALDAATGRLVAAIRDNVERLDEPSLLPGWSRATILAHLRYVAEAMHRMTEAAMAGRDEDMYPGGRDVDRPGTLLLRGGETSAQLVDSVETSAAALSTRWHDLSPSDWNLTLRSADFGTIALSRYLALRFTEIEVHSADLGLDAIGAWSDTFVDTLLPLRLAWLGLARRRRDADLSLNGSWLLSDRRESSWLVKADGPEVLVGEVPVQRSAYCRLTGTRRDLLAMLLGRPSDIEPAGLPELATGFKTAFPGP